MSEYTEVEITRKGTTYVANAGTLKAYMTHYANKDEAYCKLQKKHIVRELRRVRVPAVRHFELLAVNVRLADLRKGGK